MSRDLNTALARTGALDPSMLAQFARWKAPIDIEVGPMASTPEEAKNILDEALEARDLVEVRESDLDLWRIFQEDRERGKLHLVTGKDSADLDCEYVSLLTGEIVIAWHDDSLEDFVVNGETYLRAGRQKIYFSDYREVFYGDVKAFMVLTPTPKEALNGRS